MTWVVFVVSVVLAVAGAFAIVSGAPIIQIERGWAEVIAGSVALSSSMVVFALGVVSLHLLDIRRALEDVQGVTEEALPDAEAPLAAPARDERSERIERARDLGAPDPVLAEDAPAIDTSPRQALWKRVRGPEAAMDVPIDVRSQPSRSPRIDPEPTLIAASAIPTPELAVDRAEATLGTAAPPVRRGRDPIEDRSLGPIVPASVSPRASLPAADPPEPHLRDSHLRGTLADHPEPEPVEPAPAPKPIEQPAAEHDAEQEEANPAIVTEVGRYQAESASYIMYSDGTIQVETENGDVHRFGSMSELRVYIGRQDQTAE